MSHIYPSIVRRLGSRRMLRGQMAGPRDGHGTSGKLDTVWYKNLVRHASCVFISYCLCLPGKVPIKQKVIFWNVTTFVIFITGLSYSRVTCCN